MTRVLFVDDEPQILTGLRDMLRPLRREWDAVVAESAEEALRVLAQEPVDLLVSDMRMPRVDGAALLAEVQARHPQVIRIILTGQADFEVTLRAVRCAHQFVAKPCAPEVLQWVLRRTAEIRELLAHEGLRARLTAAGGLPALPAHRARLVAALHDPQVEPADLSRLIESDLSMTARCLQVVNSPYFGLDHKLHHVDAAVGRLGVPTLVKLVDTLDDGCPVGLDRLHRHSVLVARIARRLVGEGPAAHAAYTAGLLHDVGAIFTDLPPGVSHAAVGAYLLGIWGLPPAIVDAVAHHDRPGVPEGGALAVTDAVHVADMLAHELEPDTAPTSRDPRDDASYCSPRMDAWRALAHEEADVRRSPLP